MRPALSRALGFVVLPLFVGLLATSCAAPRSRPGAAWPMPNVGDPPLPPPPMPRVPSSPIVDRGESWVSAQVPYCQAPNHKKDRDKSCASTCTRPDVAAWDAYRSDCAGFVSFAWSLPAPGRTTRSLAPFTSDVSHVIQGVELAPGDAINNTTHAMLFKGWIVPEQEAVFLEEPGCDSPTPFAHEITARISIQGSTVILEHSKTPFTAIRLGAG